MTTHTEHESDDWTINIGDHPDRKDTPLYGRSRKHMITAVQAAQPWFFGPPPYQDHHGGGVWVLAGNAPTLYMLPAGIEWSAQFCADPVKVDRLRQMAVTLVNAFPDTRDWYTNGLYMVPKDIRILDTTIFNAAGISAWTDSFWNACVPLPQSMHTGFPPKSDPGYHHAPKPIVDIRTFKRDDFVLFPTPGLAVVPVAPYGSGDARVRVLWNDEESTSMFPKNHPVGTILPAQHPVAMAAFNQQGESP